MSNVIKDGKGTGNTSKVRGNRLFTHSISEAENLHATEKGDGYNLNTGTIALTSSTESGVMYLKNNEDQDFIVESIAVGIGSAGTVTDSSIITLVRNPTSVSFSAAVDINQNRDFGSNKTLTADVFKGAEAATITGGDDLALFYQAAGGRLFAAIDFVLQKGNSLAIKVDTQTSSGTTNVYAAIIGHLKNPDFKD